MSLANPADGLPWSERGEDHRRLNRFLFASLLPALLLGAVIPHLRPQDLPRLPELRDTPRPVRLAFEPPPEPVPVVEAAPRPAPLPDPSPAPRNAEAATPAARDQTPTAPAPKPLDRTAELRESLQRLRDNPDVLAALSNRPLKQAVTAEQPRHERLSADLDQGAVKSGPATPRRQHGELALSGHDSTKVEAPGSGRSSGPASSQTRGGGGGRSSQEIQTVMERHKAAIHAIYERALREDPALAGKLVLRISIEPDGRVSACEIISDQLGHEEVTRRVVLKIRQLNFGAKAVPTQHTEYPIEFFPRQ